MLRIGFLAIHRGSKSLTKHCCSEWLAAPHLWDSQCKQRMCDNYKNVTSQYITYVFLSSKIINQYLDISFIMCSMVFPILTIFFMGLTNFWATKNTTLNLETKKKLQSLNSSRCALELRPHSAHDLIGPLGTNSSVLELILLSSQ